MAFKYKITQITTTVNGTDLAAAGSIQATAVLVDEASPSVVINTQVWTASGITLETTAVSLRDQMFAFFRLRFNQYLRAKELETMGQPLLNTLRDLV